MAGLGDVLSFVSPGIGAIQPLRKGINKFGSAIKEPLFGSPGHVEQTPLYNKEQMQTLSQMLQQAMGGMQENQKNFGFDNIEQRARSDFQSKTLPGIRELFNSMGSGEGSSAYQPALASAGADLESNLGMMRQQYGQQQHGNLMQMLQMAMRPQFENNYMAGSGGLLGNLMGGMSGSLGESMGQGMGNKLPSWLPLLFA